MTDSLENKLFIKDKILTALSALFSSFLSFILIFFLAMFIVNEVYPPYTIDPVTGKELHVMATEQILISFIIAFVLSFLIFIVAFK